MNRTRLRRILGLALPIIGGMVSQNVLNIVDIAMVSRLGKAALAAVGFGGLANFLGTAFITGMGVGVQAAASRRLGEGRNTETAVPLNGGLLMVLAIGLPLSIILVAVTPSFFPLLSTDPAVVELGVPYLQARYVALIAIGANFAFRGYWNGVNLSRIYLYTLVVMHACNVLLNYCLIFGHFGFPALGATGAGIGTSVSTAIGTGCYFFLAGRYARDAGFLRGIPSWNTIKTMLRTSVPSGLQSLLYAAGLTTLYAILQRVGTEEVAAASVLMNLSLVAYLPAIALGLTAASLVGQALGRRDVDDAERWGWDVVRVAIGVLAILGLPMAIAPEFILSGFLANEPAVLEIATAPLRLVGLTVWLEAVVMVLLNAVMGAGDTRRATIIAVGMQWGVFLPSAVILGPVWGYGLFTIWVARAVYRAATGVLFMGLWRSRRWATAEV